MLERAAQKLRLDQLFIRHTRPSTTDEEYVPLILLHSLYIINASPSRRREQGEASAHGAEKIISATEACVYRFVNPCISLTWGHRTFIKDDIEAIISRGEERTQQLTSKYEGLNLEDLSNGKARISGLAYMRHLFVWESSANLINSAKSSASVF
jgi:SWI/SNF-related matrix-associated actin-dependent regulator of chromatin subfamily A member 5